MPQADRRFDLWEFIAVKFVLITNLQKNMQWNLPDL